MGNYRREIGGIETIEEWS